MKLRFITNACCIYEHDGYRLLADPWLVPGAFGTWVHEPPLKTRPQSLVNVDALYISHIHPDHLDEKTLVYFRRDIPIITLKDRLSLCAKHLERLGFERITALEDHRSAQVGPFQVTMFAPFTKHPFHGESCELGNVVDSAILIRQGKHSVLNCNDNAMSVKAAHEHRMRYGQPTVAQLNSNAAGAYPACFRNLSHQEKMLERTRILIRQTNHMVEVAKALGAEIVQPFAGQYRLGYGLEHLNQYLPVWSQDEIARYLRNRDVSALELAEGEVFEL